MESKEFGEYLRKIRKSKKLTVRQLDLYSGVSHSYISQMERGARGIPTPEILKKLSKPLGVEYEELMRVAGYLKETKNKNESAYTLPESEIDLFIKEREAKYGVIIRDDPVFQTALRNLIDSIAQTKADQQNSRNQE